MFLFLLTERINSNVRSDYCCLSIICTMPYHINLLLSMVLGMKFLISSFLFLPIPVIWQANSNSVCQLMGLIIYSSILHITTLPRIVWYIFTLIFQTVNAPEYPNDWLYHWFFLCHKCNLLKLIWHITHRACLYICSHLYVLCFLFYKACLGGGGSLSS